MVISAGQFEAEAPPVAAGEDASRPRSSVAPPGRSPSPGSRATRSRWPPSSWSVPADGAALRRCWTRWASSTPTAQRPGAPVSARCRPDAFGGASLTTRSGVEPATGRDVLSRLVSGVTTVADHRHLGDDHQRRDRHGPGHHLPASPAAGSTSASAAVMDLVLSFPQTLMLLALSPVLIDRITALGVPPGDPSTVRLPHPRARLLRLAVLRPHHPRSGAVAARARVHRGGQVPGRQAPRIYFKELLPNLWAPILVYTTLILPANIAAEAALGFLGVGLKPPTPSLGTILNDSVNYSCCRTRRTSSSRA